MVREWYALYIFISKCVSRHNGVQFFFSHLASWLRTRRFREPTFRPSGAPNHWKNTVLRDFPTFSHIYICFFLFFFLLIFLFFLPLPCSPFHLCILLEIIFWLQNVFRATTACTFSRSKFLKVVRIPNDFSVLTSKCAWRHNYVHFFDISIAKNGPTMVYFVHFHLEMCFAQ